METNLERFKREMEPAREIYTREIREFAKRYDELGEMTAGEFPDIDVQEYIFDFEKRDDVSQEALDRIISEISEHMEEFSKIHGIERFDMFSCIWV